MSPPTEPDQPKPTSIDDLPPEMICELFEHLHPKDLATCALVNKRWYWIYAGFKVRSLAAIDGESDPRRWKYPARRIEDRERCTPELLYELADRPLLSNLSHLALHCHGDQFHPDLLKSFSRLVYLELGYGYFFRLADYGRVNLKSPKLRVLVCSYNNSCYLSIDCPELSVLEYSEESEDRSLLNVKQPETIRKLETYMFGSKLDPFKCVECLVTRELKVISRATLLSLPRLKELHYNVNITNAFLQFDSHEAGTLDRMKRTLSEFLGHVKQLKRADLQFRFAGFLMTPAILDAIDFDVKLQTEGYRSGEWMVDDSYVYLKNYQLIEPNALPFIYHVDYNHLMSCVVGEFPACFSQKFSCVEEVYAGGVIKDARHFRWFLSSLRLLVSLNLTGSQLGQEFYDQLPTLAGSIVELRMDAHTNGLPLSFNFIRELPSLIWSQVNECSSFESASSLAQVLREFKDLGCTICFDFKELHVVIMKYRGSFEWEIQNEGGDETLLRTDDYEDASNEVFDYLRVLLNEQESKSD